MSRKPKPRCMLNISVEPELYERVYACSKAKGHSTAGPWLRAAIVAAVKRQERAQARARAAFEATEEVIGGPGP